MAAAPPGSFRDLHFDRRNLYACICRVAGPRIRNVVARRGLERRRGRGRAETVFPRTLRQGVRWPLSGDGLERVDCLRRRYIVAAATGAVVHRCRWLAL